MILASNLAAKAKLFIHLAPRIARKHDSVETRPWHVSSAMKKKLANDFNQEDVSRIIEMAWEDRTPFDAIEDLYGLTEAQTITLMRQEMKASSFRMWRKRMTGRTTKHKALRSPEIDRAYCPTQYKRA